MAPLFWLKITDWKKDCDQVNISEQSITSYFSSSELEKNQVKIDSAKSLRYFDKEADLNVTKMQEIFNQLKNKIKFPRYEPYKVFSDFKEPLLYINNSIIASKSVLSRIMNTPFEINHDRRKWIINAKIFKDSLIYLYYDKDHEHNITENIDKQYEILKRYLFVKYPLRYQRKVITVFNEMFGAFILLKIGHHLLYYTTEIAGVMSENQITTLEELNAAEQIYCDTFEAGEFSDDIINYNPIWWSKAVLSKAKECILVSYDKDNDCLEDIYKFNMEKFEDKTKYENLWSPDAAWNFLNDFLQFVKDTVNGVSSDIKKKCIWKFQSFPDDEPFVSCEILIRNMENDQENLTPVDETSFS